MDPLEIKAALVRAGITQRRVARAAKVSESLVSAVIKALRTEGRDAKRVQWEIAKLLDRPVQTIWP